MQLPVVWSRTLALCAGLASSASLTACDSGPASPDGSAVDSVVVAPSTATVLVGSSLSLTAEVLDKSGQVIPSLNVAWSSEDVTIADVSRIGVVTGVSAGTVQIAASSWGKNAIATITVNPVAIVLPAVDRIVIAPTNPRVRKGETIQLTATALDKDGRVITGLTVTWSSSNTNRATVDNTGQVHAIDDGNASITASAGGKSTSTNVRIDG